MTEIVVYVIDRSPHLLVKIVRILVSFAILIAVFILVSFILILIGGANFNLYYPPGFSMRASTEPTVMIWIVFALISILVAHACGALVAGYFYTEAHLWEVRMFFKKKSQIME